jgi:O-antigen/teichoic acid export membrane protein
MSLRKQTLWSMLPILLTSIVSIVSVPIYFRVLGAEMYAIWFYVGTLTGAFGFMDLGLGVAVGRFIGVALGRNDTQAVKEYWATGNALVLPFVLFFAIVFVVIGATWGPGWFNVQGSDATTLRWAMLWGGLGLFFNYYGQMWNILTQTYLDFKYLSILRTWIALLTMLGTIGVALIWKNVAVIVALTTLFACLQFVLLFWRGKHHYQLPLRFQEFRMARLREMLPYTLKTFGQLISGSVLGSLDRVFLGRIAPALDFAAFNVSINIGSRISGLSVAIMGPVFHNTTRGVGGDTTRKPSEVYQQSFDLMFAWYSLAIVGVFFWSSPVTEFWLGSKYGSAVGDAFPWIVSALCLNAIANISGAQMGGLDRVGTGLILQTIISIGSVVGVVAGFHFFDLRGAAIGFFLPRILWIVQDLLVRRWIGIDQSLRSILWIPFRQILLVATVYIPSHLITSNIAYLTCLAIVSAALCVGAEFRFMRKSPGRCQTPAT